MSNKENNYAENNEPKVRPMMADDNTSMIGVMDTNGEFITSNNNITGKSSLTDIVLPGKSKLPQVDTTKEVSNTIFDFVNNPDKPVEKVSFTPSTIFNQHDDLNRTHRSVFLDAPAGALNTIVISHPYLWKLYKRLRSLDWDANEFDHSRSKAEMASASESDVYKIVMTLLWQWEADSTASRVITDIICAFWPGTELSALAQRIAENESLHSHSYSEIVKNCFEDIDDVMRKLADDIEPLKRLTAVGKAFKECLDTANRFRMGEYKIDSDEVKRARLLFFGAIITLERIQFTGSFNVTFTYGDRGSWNSIAKTVQKIAVDELAVHVRTWKYCFRNEASMPEYKNVMPGVLASIKAMVAEVLSSELAYCDLLYKDNVPITRKGKSSVTCDMLKQSIRFEAQNVFDFFGFELPFARIDTHPLPYTLRWKDINSVQTSPQEELTGNYLLGGFINDLAPSEAHIPSFMKSASFS